MEKDERVVRVARVAVHAKVGVVPVKAVLAKAGRVKVGAVPAKADVVLAKAGAGPVTGPLAAVVEEYRRAIRWAARNRSS